MTSAANPNVAGYFPENEELRVTSAPLMAASFYIGEQCMKQNDDFKLCKRANDNNPSACLKEGRRVTNCVQNMQVNGHESGHRILTRLPFSYVDFINCMRNATSLLQSIGRVWMQTIKLFYFVEMKNKF